MVPHRRSRLAGPPRRAAAQVAAHLGALAHGRLGPWRRRLAAALDLATADELAGIGDRVAALTERLRAVDGTS